MAAAAKRLDDLGHWLESLPSRKWMLPAVWTVVTLLFLISNVPWHLDNYDQAKQAYVAFEIDHTGSWFYQTTPAGKSASKPPLMGWISAALHAVGIPWDWAFRLPSLIAAFGIASLLGWTGWQLWGRAGCLLAVAAFGLNLLTPRLATLVRTDMLLAFFIFIPGWIIYLKLRSPARWTIGERVAFGCAMAGALLTKGPVIYAFLLPGLVVMALCLKDPQLRRMLWSGWLPWILPLVLFLAWGITGLFGDDTFYQDVVVREFFSRFQEGSRSDERPQPWWFYFPHLIHKFAPWSLFLAASFIVSKQLRGSVRQKPELLWCVLWVLGGLIVMTLIPAKRVDRIYPLIPPLSLLVVEVALVLASLRWARVATGASLVVAMGFTGGYFFGLIPISYSERADALVKFSEKVNQETATQPGVPLYLVRARDEGLLIYLNTPRFLSTSEFEKTWNAGDSAFFLISDRMHERYADRFMNHEAIAETALIHKNESGYRLYKRLGVRD